MKRYEAKLWVARNPLTIAKARDLLMTTPTYKPRKAIRLRTLLDRLDVLAKRYGELLNLGRTTHGIGHAHFARAIVHECMS